MTLMVHDGEELFVVWAWPLSTAKRYLTPFYPKDVTEIFEAAKERFAANEKAKALAKAEAEAAEKPPDEEKSGTGPCEKSAGPD